MTHFGAIRAIAAAAFALGSLQTCAATPVVSASAFIAGHDARGKPVIKLRTGSAGPTGGAGAWASYAASYTKIGWDVLNVTTAPAHAGLSQPDAMFAAGYLEGYLTQPAIWNAYQNMYPQFFTTGSPPPQKFTTWITEHMEWVTAQVASNQGGQDAQYWEAVGSVLSQLDGVSAGYSAAAKPGQKMTPLDMLIMNLDGDLETLMGAIGLGRSAGEEIFQSLGFLPGAGYHCSALVRLPTGADDIFFGHDTWDTYASMVRMYKHYNFHLGPRGTSTPVSMSSTPGWLSSVDDFYLTGADLGVIETTNGLRNDELLKLITPKGGLMSWVRVMVANYLGTDGKSWTNTFSKYNGGTYNNQWFVVDMKKFVRGRAAQPSGLLWVLEQIPGFIHSADQTEYLTKMGYWASYNAPFYKDIANRSGMVGAWDNAPRHFLFQRNATMVNTLETFGDLMRYNNYKYDPLSHGNPSDAIMARGDLAGNAGGGIDSKITSWAMSSGGKRAALAMNGPTHSQLPPFSWSTFTGSAPTHVGQPDVFQFEYEHMDPFTIDY